MDYTPCDEFGAQGIYGGGGGVDFSVANECMPDVDGIAMPRLERFDVGAGIYAGQRTGQPRFRKDISTH